MTTVFYAEPEIVIALNRKAIFVNPNDLQIFKELTLPEKLDIIKKEEIEATSSANGTDAAKQDQEQPQQHIPPTIQHVSYSPDRQLIAVTTAGTKALLLYRSRPEHAKLLSARELARAASAITFAHDGSSVLVTDKTGDCYLYDCNQVEAPPKLLLGHLAIVYDVIWTPDSKYIITCDRDDKIRVTNYPNTYDIHTYCLGHKEFVTGLALLEGSALLSVSGDGTLRIWNYESGKELYKYELPAPALRLNVRLDKKAGNYLVSVQLHQPQESVGLYELSQTDRNEWSVKQLVLYNFGEAVVSNFCFVEDRLYAAIVSEERLALQVYDAAGKVWSPKENWLEMVREQFADDVYAQEDFSVWFKKRYDNVSEYLERKRRRIEEKNKSRNDK